MAAHCYLCQLSHNEFLDLLKDGKSWSSADLLEVAAQVGANPKLKLMMGVKDVLWRSFIPVENFVVPLLHVLIGVFNDLWDKCRWIVSELIDYVSPEEANYRARLVELQLQSKIERMQSNKKDWDKSEDGKKLTSLTAKARCIREIIHELCLLSNLGRVDTTSEDSPLSDFLVEVGEFIDGGDIDNIELEEAEEDAEETNAAIAVRRQVPIQNQTTI